MQGRQDSDGLELSLTACAIHTLSSCQCEVSARGVQFWGAPNGAAVLQLSTGSHVAPAVGLKDAVFEKPAPGKKQQIYEELRYRSLRRYEVRTPYIPAPLTGCFILTHPLIHDFQDPPLLFQTPPPHCRLPESSYGGFSLMTPVYF